MLTKKQLQGMNEDNLTRKVIQPLLMKMGFRDVVEWHGGPLEQGKDLVCWKPGDLSRRTNYAIVAKAVPINGVAGMKRGSASEVFFQIQQAFKAPFRENIDGSPQLVHQCWVITNKEISKEAKESIMNALPDGFNRLVSFIDGDTLWDLVQQYLPIQGVWEKVAQVQETLAEFDTHYSVNIRVTDSMHEVAIVEKFPGAAREKPFVIKTQFEFPDTPDAQSIQDGLRRFFATGAPVEIPPEFIKSFELPDFAKPLFDDLKDMSLQLSTAQTFEKRVFRIDLLSDDGEHFVSDPIELKTTQAGDEEMTLTNEDQLIPLKVQLIIRPQEQLVTMNMSFDDGDMNVNQLLSKLKFQKCISKPVTIRLYLVESNICVLEIKRVEEQDGPHPRLMAMIEDLVGIQNKIKQPITFPDRELTEDELLNIRVLREILQTGKMSGTWESLVVKVPPERLRDMLLEGEANRQFHLRAVGDDAIELFGSLLPLGPIEAYYESARIQNENELRDKLEGNEFIGLSDISVTFVPGDNNKGLKIYRDWLQEAAIIQAPARALPKQLGSRASKRKTRSKRRK